MNANETIVPPEADSTAPQRMPRGALLFSAALFTVGCIFLGMAVWRIFVPKENPPAYERNLADEAKQLLRREKPQPLSEPLEKILADAERLHFESAQHLLLGKAAPDITGLDVNGQPWSLKESLKKGPVVVVFYLGYHCNHCVSQLFDLHEDYARFRELGAEIVALGPDPISTTKERYKQYGPFAFPVLTDSENRVSQAYGVFTRATKEKPENLDHGTFIVDQQGIIRWAAFGPTPFGHNPTLLHELAKLRKK